MWARGSRRAGAPKPPLAARDATEADLDATTRRCSLCRPLYSATPVEVRPWSVLASPFRTGERHPARRARRRRSRGYHRATAAAPTSRQQGPAPRSAPGFTQPRISAPFDRKSPPFHVNPGNLPAMIPPPRRHGTGSPSRSRPPKASCLRNSMRIYSIANSAHCRTRG